MRRVRQPGPAPAERAVAVPVRAVPIAGELPAGRPLLAALHALCAQAGVEGAALSLADGALGPFA